MDYHKFNQMVTTIEAAISLLEEVNTLPATWYAAIDLENVFFFLRIHKTHQKQFSFPWKDQEYTFTDLPQEYISSPG